VLNNCIYRDNARKLQKAIAEANGLSAAADLVEKALGATAERRDYEYSGTWEDDRASLRWLPMK
jgi:hypothetical protein